MVLEFEENRFPLYKTWRAGVLFKKRLGSSLIGEWKGKLKGANILFLRSFLLSFHNKMELH
jgi:hypothetical protein